ncbi:MAG: tripartite tricarboxylate transporter substrate binding protein [Burkholderiales bacterium]|nr:tripartite tricarboxylate transporter substrate binding protein [Burkholderiales bacterium]
MANAQRCAVVTVFVILGAWASPTFAQQPTYPVKPIRILVPLIPGGLTDLMSRVIGQKFTESWGQPTIVDNRPGASGQIASDIVAKAAPVGQTLITVSLAHAVNASIYPKLPYDTVRDFTPVIYLADTPQILFVHPQLKVGNVRDLIALAKAKPGELNFSSGGVGGSSHMAMELFRHAAGIELQHIPYKGGAQATLELVANRVELNFGQWVSSSRFIKSGQLRALGVSTPKRIAVMPDTPTIAESGLPGFESRSWYGILAPAKLPKPILTKLHSEIARIVAGPDFGAKFASEAVVVGDMTSDQFAEFIREEIRRYATVVKSAKLTPG